MFGIRRLHRPESLTLSDIEMVGGQWEGEQLTLSFASHDHTMPQVNVVLSDTQITHLIERLASQPMPDRHGRPLTPDPDQAASHVLGHTATCLPCLHAYLRQLYGRAHPFAPETKIDNTMLKPLARALVAECARRGDDPDLIHDLSIIYIAAAAGLDKGQFFTE